MAMMHFINRQILIGSLAFEPLRIIRLETQELSTEICCGHLLERRYLEDQGNEFQIT
jgi:hypothetical protein